MTTTRQIDRRHAVRIAASGSVIVHARRGARGRARDLSQSGIGLQLADGEPPCRVGDRVVLELHLDSAGSRWLRFGGRVQRAGMRGAMSVAFREVPVDFADLIQEELLAELEDAAATHVLLVDPIARHRERSAATLRRGGCQVAEAATPLEAVRLLIESRAHPWVIAIADTVPAAIADELQAFLAIACDRPVEVVTLGDDGAAEMLARPRS